MMTTFAAIFGTLPIALGAGAGAELRQPLGIAVVGGLCVSQLLTLFITPVIYIYLDRIDRASNRAAARPHVVRMDAKAEGLQVVPFIRPYRVRADIQSWFGDPVIFDLVQDEFKRGYYRGIGEFHLSGKAADNEWVKKTVDFAVANNLYLHAHADDEAVEILMRHNPRARIIWAHTGFGLSSDRVSAMLPNIQSCGANCPTAAASSTGRES
jgi:hypothetical protein